MVNAEGATAILNGGTFMRSQEKGINPYNNGKNSWYTIQNLGDMTINKGVIVENSGYYSSNIVVGGKKCNPLSNLKITGGTLKGGVKTVKVDDYGNLEITGGTFTNEKYPCIMNWYKAVITGGTFTSPSVSVENGCWKEEVSIGDLTITGGTFNGDISGTINVNGTVYTGKSIAISGGTFSTEVKEEYCAAGYAPKYDESTGTYTVKEKGITWIGTTDSGIYTVDNTKYGVMRFMFSTDVSADKVTNIGIKYISSSFGTPTDGEQATGKICNATDGANKNAVQGDINNIDINKPLAEKYYAAAFIKVDGKTYWSTPISCTLNTSKELVGYTPQTEGGNN